MGGCGGSMRSSRKGRFAGIRRRRSILPSLKEYQVNFGGERMATPLNMPILPSRLHSRTTPCKLATMEEGGSDSPNADTDGENEVDEWFTLGPIPSSIFPSIAKLLPTPSSKPKLTITPVHVPKPKAETLDNSPADISLDFNLDIFSPRMPSVPTIRGLMDALGNLPLELPSPDTGRPSLMALFAKGSFPTPLIQRNPASSPVVSASETGMMPSLGGIATEIISTSPKPRSGSLSPQSRLDLLKSPKGFTSPHLSGRRMSAIIRPPILPTPTPPFLLSSPRSLGTPIIPNTLSPSNKRHSLGRSGGYSSLPFVIDASTKRHRPSRAMNALSPSGSLSLGGLGLGMIERGEGEVSKEHIATPGTFGLEGEAERRLVTEGVNPYFA